MYEKYRLAHFGRCPHVFCQGQPVLPVGLSDLPRNYTVNVFCPRCHGLFFPKSTRQANIDGAYFGTTFPHLYLMTHPVSTKSTVTYLSFRTFSSIDIYIYSLRTWYPPSRLKRISHASTGFGSTNRVLTTPIVMTTFGIPCTVRKPTSIRPPMIDRVVVRDARRAVDENS
jgi:hypothetical protein